MSTDKSLKHLKSNDKLLIANVSNYFEKHSGRDSSSYSGNWGQQKNRFPSTKRTIKKLLHFRRRNVRNGDNTNLWTTLMRLLSETMCRSFTPTAILFRP